MMQLKKLRRLLMTAAFCVMTNTVSLAGNDSVAIVYLTSFQQNQQQIEATIYQSQTYNIPWSSPSYFYGISD